MALTFLSSLPEGSLASVGEIARTADIPRELLAKILSELVKAGLTLSCSGPTGGFRLAKPASTLSLAEILAALERKPGLVECQSGENGCRMTHNCRIKSPIARVQRKVHKIFEETMLDDLMVRYTV